MTHQNNIQIITDFGSVFTADFDANVPLQRLLRGVPLTDYDRHNLACVLEFLLDSAGKQMFVHGSDLVDIESCETPDQQRW